jgi:hypothetical protein
MSSTGKTAAAATATAKVTVKKSAATASAAAKTPNTKSASASLKDKKRDNVRKRRIFSATEKDEIIERSLSKPGCVRLARRSGIKRVEGSLYEALRYIGVNYHLVPVLRKMEAYVSVCKRKTATDRDAKEALKDCGIYVVGYGAQNRGASSSSKKSKEVVNDNAATEVAPAAEEEEAIV